MTRESLQEVLESYHFDNLKEMAEYVGVDQPRRNVRKAWLVRELRKTLLNQVHVERYLQALGEAERATLSLMLQEDRVYTMQDLILPLLNANLLRSGTQGDLTNPTFQQILQNLLRRGLVVNLSDDSNTNLLRNFDSVTAFGVHHEVRPALLSHNLEFPDHREGPHQVERIAPPYVQSGDLKEMLRWLFFAWSELRRQPARELKSGAIGKRDARRVARSLGYEEETEDDIEFAREIIWFLVALNLVTVQEEGFCAVDNDAATLFWDMSLVRQAYMLLDSYQHFFNDLAVDLSNIDSLGYYYQISALEPEDVRAKVVEMLKQLSNVYWLPFKTFLEVLNEGQPGNVILSTETLSYIRDSWRWYSGRLSNMESSLAQLESRAVIAILQELCMYGLVDLGYASADADQPQAMQPSRWLRAYLAGETAPSEERELLGQVILQPDFQLLAMGPVPLRVLAILERFAVREKVGDSVISYRITREGVYEAFKRGETVESVRVFLEETTGQPVPQNVLRSLEEWEQQYERIVLMQDVTVLQADSEEILDQLMQDRELARLLHRLDAQTAWLHASHAERLESRLLALEVLPSYSAGQERDLQGSLRWEGEQLRPRHGLPSLYVTGTLRRIAQQKDDHWRLTPESVYTAVTMGMTVPEITATLEQMVGETLSEEWQKRLKAWGKYYGDGQTAQVRLLHLKDAATLTELRRADRRLSRWLRPMPKAPGLAVVNSHHWEEVQELLAEWGVEITSGRWW